MKKETKTTSFINGRYKQLQCKYLFTVSVVASIECQLRGNQYWCKANYNLLYKELRKFTMKMQIQGYVLYCDMDSRSENVFFIWQATTLIQR